MLRAKHLRTANIEAVSFPKQNFRCCYATRSRVRSIASANHDMSHPAPRVAIVSGVSGSGKSTTARFLMDELQSQGGRSSFIEADDYHSSENRAKMQRGQPLNDEDRQPWLEALAQQANQEIGAGKLDIVMACSALKRKYRQFLRDSIGANATVFFILLDPPYDVLLQHVTDRNHFMPPSLLQSQLKTLEPGDDFSLCVTAFTSTAADAQECQELGHPASSGGAITQGSSFVGGASFACAARGSTGAGEDLRVARGLLQLSGSSMALDTAMFSGNYPDAQAVAAEVCSWLEKHSSPD